jgi:hypothetical protein
MSTVRHIFAILLIFVFSGMALLGFLGIICEGGASFCCMASIMRGVLCSHDDSIAAVNSHIGFLKEFSKAAANFSLAALFAVLSFVYVAAVLHTRVYAAAFISPLVISKEKLRLGVSMSHLWRKKFTHWLIFHEVSPTYA